MKQKPIHPKKRSGRAQVAGFNEEYEVSLDYPKDDGLWVCSHKEHVEVFIPSGKEEKNSHDEAGRIAQARFRGSRVNGVSYL